MVKGFLSPPRWLVWRTKKIGGWETPLKSEVGGFAVHRDISIMPILLKAYHAVYSTYKAHDTK